MPEKQNPEQLLPDDFKKSLELVPENKAVSLLTRHSIREQAENYNAHHKLPLTQEGIALARYWGGLQIHPSFKLYSSPVGRCQETALHMFASKSAVKNPQLETVALLTEPGCFIESREQMAEVGQYFLNDGPIIFMNRILNAEFAQLKHPRVGVRKLLTHIRAEQAKDLNVLNIHVSHDTILAAFVYTLLGKKQIQQEEWPRMMEGVYLWFDNDLVQGVWRGEYFECGLGDFE